MTARPDKSTARDRRVCAPAAASARTAAPLDDALARVRACQAALANTTDLNPVAELLASARRLLRDVVAHPEDKALLRAFMLAVRIVSQSMVSLCEKDALRLECVDEEGHLSAGADATDATDAQAAVARWLAQQWNAFVSLLHASMVPAPVPAVRLAAVEMSMALQSAASESLARRDGGARWSTTPFRSLVRTLLQCDLDADVLDKLADEYLDAYDDVRYAFCREMGRVLRRAADGTGTNAHLRARARAALARITAVPTEAAHLNAFLVPHLAAAPRREAAAPQRRTRKPAFSEDGAGSDEDDAADAADTWLSDSDEETRAAAPVPAAPAGARRRNRARSGNVRDAVHSLAMQRQAFSAAWLGLLLPQTHRDASGALQVHGGRLSLAETHSVLVLLHTQILPHLAQPTMLHDFLVDCLDAGGTTALLALNGLFTLIVSHNLDYPAFYTRLYAMLDASVMHTRYRSRFMRMLDTFLGSSHLPVAIVASFAKRLGRLALRASPAAVVETVPFVWNLLRRHPSCLQMIHRDWQGDHLALGPAGLADPFDAHERNPLHTRALESSLWELAALGAFRLSQTQQHRAHADGGDAHYLASVASFASILAEPFARQRYELEDFLDTTYTTLFDAETKKTLKRKEREGKPPRAPAVAALDLVLAVPPMLATKSGNADDAVRRETRKRLRRFAFPARDGGEREACARGDEGAYSAVEKSRREMPLDDCARLWTL
ncbi:Maturation and nuclear export of 40S ribosomal subunits interacting protein [Malassezia sp. CBS 17886]|nr:Maturation and nuclear export of 40S ribosomal subunits interacting protein [Malassezia sp. CBS 17886]